MELILIGGKGRVGKTITSKLIAAHAFEHGLTPHLYSFAQPIRESAVKAGYDRSEDPQGYRRFCQELGEGARAEDIDHWVKVFDERVRAVETEEEVRLARGEKNWESIIICDDLRYLNEVIYGRSLDARILFLHSGKRELQDADAPWREHESEILANNVETGVEEWDLVFRMRTYRKNMFMYNDGSIEEWHQLVGANLDKICGLDIDRDETSKSVEEVIPELDTLFNDIIERFDNLFIRLKKSEDEDGIS